MNNSERTRPSDSLSSNNHMKYQTVSPSAETPKSASVSENPLPNPLSMLTGNLLPIDHFRLKLYNYAMVERLRFSQFPQGPAGQVPGMCSPQLNGSASALNQIHPSYVPRLALSMGIFHNRMFQPAEEPKPQHSYIGLIAMAILSSAEAKLVLSDIYQHILDNYPYFRSRGPGWRNSIRHNLSLNDCFIKAGRSANGKGHYWAIHPANVDDFKKGDFRRRKAQRKVRKHMGLAVDDEGTDSPSPPPLPSSTSPTSLFPASWSLSQTATIGVVQQSLYQPHQRPAFPPIPFHHRLMQHHHSQLAAFQANNTPIQGSIPLNQTFSHHPSSRKRQFDVASLLAPDCDESRALNLDKSHQQRGKLSSPSHQGSVSGDEACQQTVLNESDFEEDIDVVANDTDSFNRDPSIRDSSPVRRRVREDSEEEHPLRSFKVQKMSDERDEVRNERRSPGQELPHHWTSGIETKLLEQYYGHYMATAAHHASRFLDSNEDDSITPPAPPVSDC